MINAKYLEFHLAKTQQNTVLGVREAYLIDNITLVLSPPRFLSHTRYIMWE